MADEQKFAQVGGVFKPARKYVMRIEYPNAPAEVFLNAMRYVLDEAMANDIAKEYLGDIRIEMLDENGLMYRKYGRLVLKEVRQVVR